MTNRRYKPVQFGFLNTAQDSTDIGPAESPNATNLDPDELALGTLKHQQFSGEGTLRDFTTTELGGRNFLLGSASDVDRAYTEYGQGDFFWSDNYYEFPLGSGVIPTGREHVIAFDVMITDANTGYIFGNANIQGLEGASEFSISSTSGPNTLTLGFHDSTGPASEDIVNGYVEDEWYRVVLCHNYDTAVGYSIFVNGRLAAENLGVATSNYGSGRLRFGSTGNAGFGFRLRNVVIARGVSTTPADFRGQITDFGFEGPYSVILSSKDGSGAANSQDASFTKAGTPTPSATEVAAVEGKLIAEINTASSETNYTPYTQFGYSHLGGDTSARCDRDLTFTNQFFIGFAMRGDSSFISTPGNIDKVIAHLETSAAPGVSRGFRLRLDGKGLEFEIEDSVGFRAVEDLGQFYSGDTKHIALIFTDESTQSRYSYTISVYVNASLAYSYSDQAGSTLYAQGSSLRFAIPAIEVASSGTYSQQISFRDIYVGNFKTDGSANQLSSWTGSESLLRDNLEILLSAPDGDLSNNEQGFGSSNPTTVAPTTFTPTNLSGLAVLSDLIAENDGPTTPVRPGYSVVSRTDIDNGELLNATVDTGTPPPQGPRVQEQDGKAYNGPPDAIIVFKYLWLGGLGGGIVPIIEYRLDGEKSSVRERARVGGTNLKVSIDYNLEVVFTITGTSLYQYNQELIVQVKTEGLLDGDYRYVTVGVRESDTAPKLEIESKPSAPRDVRINNIDAAGQRVSNSLPVLEIPPISPGYPDFVDRVDLYRSDADTDEYVKVWSNSSLSSFSYEDTNKITDLPKIEFLKTENDETFTQINNAIGNDSGNYFMLFNKDNRLWTVPSDRKDLLLYSRENDWWGWKRENSFSFNGDIRDVVAIRDASVVNGESTLVVFTSKGIYHIVGSGVESSPYVRVPMFGGDGQNSIDTYAGSALPFNGSIFFLAKSTDGLYESGAYGQKVYQYDLQQLAELSGRIKKISPLNGDGVTGDTNELEFASLLGGDKYILKKLTNDTCLVYHKDARGWLTYSATADQDWVWESKKFDRNSQERGTVANATRFKLDYEGPLTLEFTIYDGKGGSSTKTIPTSKLPGASRTQIENMLPSNMGQQWSFKLTGGATTSVYNMWFS